MRYFRECLSSRLRCYAREQAGYEAHRSFHGHELPRLGKVHAVEKKFELRIGSLPLPFIGITDLVADVNGGTAVIDFKTAASGYDDYEVTLSDQLTAYSLAEPQSTHVAYCVFVKTKEPRIEWHFAERTPEGRIEYIEKVRLCGEDILAGKFYKRPGKHCSYCDFLPLCMGDGKKAIETLIRIT